MTARCRPSVIRRVKATYRQRLSEERGSIAILMMVVLVGLMLCALLIPSIITQDRATRFDITRVQALGAARSGIDVALGMIRASVIGGIGTSSTLPCGPISGNVDPRSNAAYAVTIEYFTFDPVTEPYPASAGMNCVAGYGTFDPRSGATTPSYSRLTSTGTAGAAINGSTTGRTLSTTYVFRTSNVTILGGTVQIQPTGTAALCMDAGSPNAPAGSAVVLQACSHSAPPAAQQVFAYRTDLTLQLVSSITAANPDGLCVNSARTPAAAGDAVQLSLCGPLGGPAAYTQQWSFNDNGQYQAAQADSASTGRLPDLCLNVVSHSANQPVVLGGCGSGWIPSPTVGPGAAALPQWINLGEFGRCLDVPGQDVSRGFLIAYPCQQNPYPGAKTWNQLFPAPAIPAGQVSVTGQILTYNNRYCLTSPGTDGGYVSVTPCAVGDPQQTWTIHGGNNSLRYSSKYTIVSGSLCLGLGAPSISLSMWSTVDVKACSGTPDQKWNANPNVLQPALINTFEK